MQDYTTKTGAYFSRPRKDIAPLLPQFAARVLEVGCGMGQTLHWLKESGRCKEAVGVEMFESAALIAQSRVDRVVVGDAEKLIDTAFEGETFDLVLCLDVLEHMIQPWSFVSKIERILRPGGLLVVSIPNVRNVSVLFPLFFAGRWTYVEEGLLDRTHLRFFTRSTALALVTTKRLKVTKMVRVIPRRLNLLTFGLIRDILTVQYLIASCRSVESSE